jgi:hypothetical protein
LELKIVQARMFRKVKHIEVLQQENLSHAKRELGLHLD